MLERTVQETAATPQNANKMISPTCFLPRIYCNRENMKINHFNYLQSKEI